MPSHHSASPLHIWIWAIRPRTLPLAAGAIVLGCGLAALHQPFNGPVFALSLLTALLLQILSNLANDYGDAMAGTDTAHRLGPRRMVGSGLASPSQMRRAILLSVALSLGAGLTLLLIGTWGSWLRLGAFSGLGLVCIVAAMGYTMGKRPYGYRGWGDAAAGLFFGPVAVLGSMALCGAPLSLPLWLPACAAGLCSTAVLNINNMRDRTEDMRAGKLTVAVRLGAQAAQQYHAGLIILSMLCWALFWWLEQPAALPMWGMQGLTLLLSLPLIRSTWLAATHSDAPCLNQQLKHTVLGSALLHTGLGLACLL